MTEKEVYTPSDAYWKDIERYSRLIDGRLAYRVGRVLLGWHGSETHKASWDAATPPNRADWYHLESWRWGKRQNVSGTSLVIADDASHADTTSYSYDADQHTLSVSHAGRRFEGMPGLKRYPGTPILGPTFEVVEISEAYYGKLHQELAHGASIPALTQQP